jgi:competence protein ComEC
VKVRIGFLSQRVVFALAVGALGVFLLIVLIVTRDKPASNYEDDSLTIEFLSVGQGDATLIHTPGHKTVLIDAGPSAQSVADYLSSRGIDTLDLIVATHNHADHIGGMPEVLKRFVVRYYVDNGRVSTIPAYAQILDLLETRSIRALKASSRTISLGETNIELLPLPPHATTQNNNSVGLILSYSDFRLIMTGDSERQEIGYWLSARRFDSVSVAKIPHHGSDDAEVDEWVAALRPRLAVVSVGSPNEYGHPSQATMAVWQRHAGKVLRTDVAGSITVTVNPTGQFRWTSSGGELR